MNTFRNYRKNEKAGDKKNKKKYIEYESSMEAGSIELRARAQRLPKW
jgi:hypothetical protein